MFKLGAREQYAAVLLDRLVRISDDERDEVLSRFAKGPVEFREVILKIAMKIVRDSRKAIPGFIFLLLLAIFFILGAISSQSLGTGLVGAFMALIAVVGLINWIRPSQRAGEVIYFLKGSH